MTYPPEMGIPGEFRHTDVRLAHEAALAACQHLGKPLAIGENRRCRLRGGVLIRVGAAPFLFTGIDTDLLLGATHAIVLNGADADGVMAPSSPINRGEYMTSDVLVSKSMRGAHALTPPNFKVAFPPGACDSHVHV